MRGRIVSLADGSRHLVVGTHAHAARGRMIELLPLDGGGPRIEVGRDEASLVRDQTGKGRGTLLRALLANRRAQEQGGGGLALRCNTLFKPFQFRPLVKFQGEATGRLLIADETGLGKTIETGYILVEEFAAGRANRVLLMVPRRSLEKWRREMRRYFGIILQEASRKTIVECVNDPSKTFHLICSHDVGRKTNHWWDELDGRLDMLVIDEIHNHIGTSQVFRRPMAEALSDASDAMLGLTATPVRKSGEDLFRILELIYPGLTQGLDQGRELRLLAATNSLSRALESEDRAESVRLCDELDAILGASVPGDPRHPRAMISRDPPWDPVAINESLGFLRELPRVSSHVTRARGRDPEIGEYTPRVVHPTHWIDPQGREADAIRDIDDLLSREFFHIHRQQLASCRPAMLDLMKNGSQGLRSFQRTGVASSHGGPTAPAAGAASSGADAECMRMVDLLRRIRRSEDAKFEELARVLEELRQDPSVTKAVIFTHFHPTFYHLKRQLEQLDMVREGVRLVLADPKDDDDVLQGINDELMGIDGFAILLATDRMSEAVDLHAANCVVNYDMPYNPQDLQQRIGRVDRIIQEADVIHVHNFAVRGTVDDSIMARIVERSRIFEAVVGGMEDVSREMATVFHRRAEVESAMGEIEDLLDRRRLVEGGDEFRMVDRVFDDGIRRAMASQSPFLSREHLVILEAFERLRPGAGHEWDSESRTLNLAVDHALAEGIHDMLGGLHTIGAEMRFELMKAARSGVLSIRLGGSKATAGPAHPFNKWVTGMLATLEDSEGAVRETSSDGPAGGISLVRIMGSKVTESLWLTEPDGSGLGEWLDRIEESGADGEVVECDESPGGKAGHPSVVALVDRDRAEHDRLLQARIRRLHAIRRRLEPDAAEPRVARRLGRVADELGQLQSLPPPAAAEVRLMHEYRAVGQG